MPTLSPTQRFERLAATTEAAIALSEDIAHIRSVVQNPDPSRAEIRRLSVPLRRLLYEHDLGYVSTPRLGKAVLEAPDNRPAYQSEKVSPFLFFASGRARVLGGWIGPICIYQVKVTQNIQNYKVTMPAFDAEEKIELRLDNFLNQRVFCYRGEWVSRKAVITYVANFNSAAHTYKNPVKLVEEYETLAKIRSSTSFKKSDTGIHLDSFKHGIDKDLTEFQYVPDSIDPVLVELLATATFLVNSPFVIELEDAIRQEIGDDCPEDP